jgi:hypothetical protein
MVPRNGTRKEGDIAKEAPQSQTLMVESAGIEMECFIERTARRSQSLAEH